MTEHERDLIVSGLTLLFDGSHEEVEFEEIAGLMERLQNWEPKPPETAKVESPPPKPKRINRDVQEALDQCERIDEMCDEMPDAGFDFADSVRERVSSIAKTIEKRDRVTNGQFAALCNMEAGIGNWLE